MTERSYNQQDFEPAIKRKQDSQKLLNSLLQQFKHDIEQHISKNFEASYSLFGLCIGFTIPSETTQTNEDSKSLGTKATPYYVAWKEDVLGENYFERFLHEEGISLDHPVEVLPNEVISEKFIESQLSKLQAELAKQLNLEPKEINSFILGSFNDAKNSRILRESTECRGCILYRYNSNTGKYDDPVGRCCDKPDISPVDE